MSQPAGFGRALVVIQGHQPGQFRIREDGSGIDRALEDTSPPRFGTVRQEVDWHSGFAADKRRLQRSTGRSAAESLSCGRKGNAYFALRFSDALMVASERGMRRNLPRVHPHPVRNSRIRDTPTYGHAGLLGFRRAMWSQSLGGAKMSTTVAPLIPVDAE